MDSRGVGGWSELAIRMHLEEFCRGRTPTARVVHELVIGEGQVRADVVSIDTAHIAAFEIKGFGDVTTRLIHQVGMFQLAVPEVWMVTAEKHTASAELVRHLIPSIGVIEARGADRVGYEKKDPDAVTLHVLEEPQAFDPVPEMMLRVLWRDELATACQRTRTFIPSSKTPRARLVNAMLDALSPAEILAACCTELRSRVALWRADEPIEVQRHV